MKKLGRISNSRLNLYPIAILCLILSVSLFYLRTSFRIRSIVLSTPSQAAEKINIKNILNGKFDKGKEVIITPYENTTIEELTVAIDLLPHGMPVALGGPESEDKK